jgi:Methyltransferase domain
MVETHGLWNGNAAVFFDDIQDAGFAMFSKEPNTLVPSGDCVEWSFVKLRREFFRRSDESKERELDNSRAGL